MGLFKTNAAKLNNRKSKIMAAFEKPLNDLKALHDKHEAHHEKVSAKIYRLAEEEADVIRSKKETAILITKFQNFLN